MIIKKIIFALYLLLISSVILISLINFTNLIMQMFLAHHNYQPIKFLKNNHIMFVADWLDVVRTEYDIDEYIENISKYECVRSILFTGEAINNDEKILLISPSAISMFGLNNLNNLSNENINISPSENNLHKLIQVPNFSFGSSKPSIQKIVCYANNAFVMAYTKDNISVLEANNYQINNHYNLLLELDLNAPDCNYLFEDLSMNGRVFFYSEIIKNSDEVFSTSFIYYVAKIIFFELYSVSLLAGLFCCDKIYILSNAYYIIRHNSAIVKTKLLLNEFRKFTIINLISFFVAIIINFNKIKLHYNGNPVGCIEAFVLILLIFLHAVLYSVLAYIIFNKSSRLKLIDMPKKNNICNLQK